MQLSFADILCNWGQTWELTQIHSQEFGRVCEEQAVETRNRTACILKTYTTHSVEMILKTSLLESRCTGQKGKFMVFACSQNHRPYIQHGSPGAHDQTYPFLDLILLTP